MGRGSWGKTKLPVLACTRRGGHLLCAKSFVYVFLFSLTTVHHPCVVEKHMPGPSPLM